MFLLTDLTKTGYFQIKKDRDLLVEKMKGIQALVEEIDLALPFLQAIYEPEIKIGKNDRLGFYVAGCRIPYNQDFVKVFIKVAPISKYKMKDDPALIEEAHKKVMDKIKSRFPNHFKEDEL
jgi:hypothetical protein